MRAARVATSLVFFIGGALLATWGPHVATVQERLSLGPGILGLALLAPAIGGLMAMLVSGHLVQHYGSAKVTRWAGALAALLLPCPILAPSLVVLVAGLLLFGACLGATDVAMNAQGVTVENAYDRPIMSSLHAQFSIGGMAGAGLATLLLSAGVTPVVHSLTVSLASLIAMLIAGSRMLPDTMESGACAKDAPLFVLPSGVLLILGVVGLLSMLGEGAMLDWIAVYLRTAIGTEPGLAAGGFAAFSAAMTLGRLLGDRAVARFGRVAILRGGGLIAACGLAAGLVWGTPAAAIAGFAAVGLGLANIVPVVFAAASRVPGVPAGHGLAAVSTVGYFGFLIGPPLIGMVAEFTSLAVGLGLVVAFGFTIALLAGRISPAALTKSGGEAFSAQPGRM